MSNSVQPASLNSANSLVASGAASANKPATNSPDQLASKEVFIQLLVAELRNQNPLSPSDPKDFLSQLSQMSGVEQMVEVRKDLDSIKSLLESQAKTTAAPAAGGTPSNG